MKHGKNDQNLLFMTTKFAENEEDLGEMALRIRTKLLKRLEHIVDHAPEGLVTEVQYKAAGMTYKLTDLVASYKNVAGKSAPSEDDPENGFDFLQEDD